MTRPNIGHIGMYSYIKCILSGPSVTLLQIQYWIHKNVIKSLGPDVNRAYSRPTSKSLIQSYTLFPSIWHAIILSNEIADNSRGFPYFYKKKKSISKSEQRSE